MGRSGMNGESCRYAVCSGPRALRRRGRHGLSILPRLRARRRRCRGGADAIVALGDSLTAGYGLAPGESFPEQLEAALRARGHDVTVANAGVSGDTASRRAGAAGMVGAGGSRRRDRGTRRQRHAARHRPGGDAKALDGDRRKAAARAGRRCCSPACWRRAISAPSMRPSSTRSIRTSRRNTACAPLPVLPGRRRRRFAA